MQGTSHNIRLMAWLKLFRIPNLFTVPGDPVAGFLLAASAVAAPNWYAMGLCALSSLLLYMAGLASNDYFDLAEDRRDRPDRPLPSGAVPPTAALGTAIGLAVAGLAAAWAASTLSLGVAFVLLVFIATYNMRLKCYRVIGPLNMGLCRGMSLLLGAAAVPLPREAAGTVMTAIAGMVLYIMAVTAIAAGETTQQRLSVRRWMPAVVILLVLVGLATLRVPCSGMGGASLAIALASSLVVAGVTLKCGWNLRGEPPPGIVAPTIGKFIRVLIPYQATLAAWSGGWGWLVALVLMALWPLAAMASRRFYAS